MRFLTILLASALAGSAMAVPEGIPIEYSDPHGRSPSPAARTRAFDSRGGESTTFTMHGSPAPCSADGTILIIVESDLWAGIEDALMTYGDDLSADGYDVVYLEVSDPTPGAVKGAICAQFQMGWLEGVVLVGNIPAGWMEGSEGEYPVDLYYMDMDGTWTDSDGDGLFDSATGWAPEVFVGRLTPTWLSYGTSVELLNEYFAKNHAYRTGALTLPDRALAYEEAFTGLTGYLTLAYSDVTLKADPAGTTADDYRAELQNGYEWVHLIAHSSPWGSSFHVGAPPAGAGTVNNYEVAPLDPQAFFFVLNCCTHGRWTEIDNMAGCYIWGDTYGLVAIAQAKTDYTNDYQELYQQLASGESIGEAFRVWLAGNLEYEHAAVLLGDPTLLPHGNGTRLGMPSHGGGWGEGNWAASQLTSGIHSEGDVDACADPASGEVFSVFGTSSTVRANILGTCSTGDTWIVPMQICEHEYWDWHPAVGVDGQGEVWTAWQSMNDNIDGYDIYVSSWNGSSWDAAVQLTDTDAFEVEPSVAGGSGKGWVVWQRWAGGESDIVGRMWTGTAWASAAEISAADGDERVPDIARSAGSYGLVYQAEREGHLAICFRDAPESGAFASETVISSGTGACREPAVAGDGASGFWAAWEQDGCIRVRHRDAGAWGPEVTVCPTGTASRPAIASSGGEAASVAWIEDGSTAMLKIHTASGWGPGLTGAACPAIESLALAYRTADHLVALYGARDAALHWDIWAASTDPTGMSGGGEAQGVLRVTTPENPSFAPVQLEITSEGAVPLRIFDLTGRLVFAAEEVTGSFAWDACDGSGSPAPAGLYLVRAGGEAAGPSSTCSLILLR